jgi:nucleoside-diphosphate-sugar epimerase
MGRLAESGQANRLVGLLHRHVPAAWLQPEGEGTAVEVRWLRGDVALPDLGLGTARYRELQEEVTAVIHCAALTTFSVSSADAQRVNVEGTRNLLRFAEGAKRLRRFVHMSTVYVAAPWSVYRLGTLVGGEATRRCSPQWSAVRRSILLYYHGLLPMLPADSDATIELLPAEVALSGAAHLFDSFNTGRTFHLCAGPAAVRVEDFLGITEAAIGEARPEWPARQIERPALVDLATYDLLGQTATDVGNHLFAQIYASVRHFAPQLLYPKRFATGNAAVALAGSGIVVPTLESYWPRVVADFLAAERKVAPV